MIIFKSVEYQTGRKKLSQQSVICRLLFIQFIYNNIVEMAQLNLRRIKKANKICDKCFVKGNVVKIGLLLL